jgi:hypothetical protein
VGRRLDVGGLGAACRRKIDKTKVESSAVVSR